MNVQVKIGDQIFDVEVGNLSARPVLATIDGETFEVWPEEAAAATPAAVAATPAAVAATPAGVAATPAGAAATPAGAAAKPVTAAPATAAAAAAVIPAAPVQRSAPAAAAAATAGDNKCQFLYAPIPGAIVSVSVKPGDKVTRGQELISLEAMKMKNAIRATRDGCIATVHVAVGDHVQKGHPLVEFSD
jgi:biotin carboxyl carrier protein